MELSRAQPANAASSLESTAEDYAIFLEAILEARGLQPSTLQEVEAPQIAVDPGCVNCVEDQGSGKLSTEIFWGFGIEKTAEGTANWNLPGFEILQFNSLPLTLPVTILPAQ